MRRYATRLSVEERRPQLLDAALETILERGYGGATLELIAKRAGVSKPVIYAVFSDRDAVLGALLDREEARVLSAITGALPPLEAVAQRPDLNRLIAEGVARLLRIVAAEPAPWQLIFTESESTPEAVRSRIARDRGLIHDGLRELMRRGLPATGREDLNPDLLAHAFFAVVERFARLAAAGDATPDPDAAGAVVAALATGGA
jgi:AcrR family transcriptional regulator